jgi:hypothetical protein
MSAFEADRFNHSRTSPENQLSVAGGQLPVKIANANGHRLTTLSKELLQDLR